MTQSTEQQLLDAARRGDRAAIEALLGGEQERLYRFGMKMCGDPEDAKEVLQESLLAAARGLPAFEGKSSLATWLYTIARSFCIKRRRRGKFAPAVERSLEGEMHGEAARVAAEGPLPDEALAAREVGRAVDEALMSLEPMYREAIVLRDVEGLSAAETAAVLGISVEAVKSRLHRARKAVREKLAPLVGEVERPADAGCPDVLAMLSAHLDGEISAATCAQMERHLAGCRRCRRACDSLKEALALCRAPSAPVPPGVQETVRRELRRLLAGGAANPLPAARLEPR
jgi:RNA polymerase sigma-70 factor (ECF subfamily)